MENEEIIFDNFEVSHQFKVRVQSIYTTLKTAEKKAVDFFIREPKFCSNHPILSVSEKAGCSQATLIRVSKKLGYSTYPELKNSILKHKNEDISLYENISKEDDVCETASKVFMSNVQAIQDTLNVMSTEEYKKAFAAIFRANKILFVGAGDASLVANSGYSRFSKINSNVMYSSDYDTQVIVASQLEENDVLIAISYSGKTKSTYQTIKCAKSKNAICIAITNYPLTPIGKLSDIILITSSNNNNNIGELITRRIPALCILESLYINYFLSTNNDTKKIRMYDEEILDYNKL